MTQFSNETDQKLAELYLQANGCNLPIMMFSVLSVMSLPLLFSAPIWIKILGAVMFIFNIFMIYLFIDLKKEVNIRVAQKVKI